jgi:crossover junction endodeoxyribonuclease RuvC
MGIIGLDLSLTGTGYATKDEVGLIKTTNKDTIQHRLITIRDEIKSLLVKFGIKQAILEDFAFGARGNAIFQIGGLQWLVRVLIYEMGIELKLVKPTELKKFVTGKGNAKKDLMLLECYKKFGESFNDDNMCDAYCLYRYGIA